MSHDTVPPSSAPIPVAVLDRLLSGEPAPGDAERIALWLAGSSDRALLLRALRDAYGAQSAASPFDAEAALRQLAQQIDAAESPAPEIVYRPTPLSLAGTTSRRGDVPSKGSSRTVFPPGARQTSWWSGRRIAVLGAALGGTLVVLLAVFARATLIVDRVLTPVTLSSYATGRTQQRSVQLPDGSRVMLAPETRLWVNVDSRGMRFLDLEGEAFFTVAPHRGVPFVVRTGSVRTRVLGTAFGVRAYPDDRVTQVSVVSGRVASGGRMQLAVLSAGMSGQITDSSATVLTGDDPALAVSWTQGRLVFRNTPVPALLAALTRWYGYDFRLADTTLTSSHVSAVLDIHQPMQALKMVKAVLGVTMTFDGNVVTLHPKHDPRGTLQDSRTRSGHDTSDSEVGR